MITIFTTCRSFENPEFNLIQRNALKSWTLLKPRPEILVMGNDPGAADICKELDLQHTPEVKLSRWNTPLLSDMFAIAERLTKNSTMLMCASDTIFFQDTIDACAEINRRFKVFCGGVRRYEATVTELINFQDPSWANTLKQKAVLGHPCAGDYYLHSKGFFKMPPFAIGRSRADNWMYHYAIRKNALVDMTNKVFTVHQTHGHPHLNSDNPKDWLKLPEFKENDTLARGQLKCIADANWVL